MFLSRCFPIACFLLAACTSEPAAPPPPKVRAASLPATQAAALAVPQHFLRWYGPRMERLSQLYYRIPGGSFKAPDGRDYYDINFKAGDAYLAALAKSGDLSPTYAARQRAYYHQQQDSLRANPADDGPAQGFEYDRIIWSQDDAELTDLLKAKPLLLHYAADAARVRLPYGVYGGEGPTSDLEFSLTRHGSRWLIDDIERVSTER